MKFDAITNRLSEKQKHRLREAKSNEDRGGLFTPDKLKLTDDQFDKVAGGGAAGKTGNGGTLKKGNVIRMQGSPDALLHHGRRSKSQKGEVKPVDIIQRQTRLPDERYSGCRVCRF